MRGRAVVPRDGYSTLSVHQPVALLEQINVNEGGRERQAAQDRERRQRVDVYLFERGYGLVD